MCGNVMSKTDTMGTTASSGASKGLWWSMRISFRGDRMKISQKLIVSSLFLIAAAIPAAAQQSAPPSSAKPLDENQRAESFYDFTMGHYYQQEYEASSRAEDANKSIDFYKKAYALDPSSQQISE